MLDHLVDEGAKEIVLPLCGSEVSAARSPLEGALRRLQEDREASRVAPEKVEVVLDDEALPGEQRGHGQRDDSETGEKERGLTSPRCHGFDVNPF
jgi:hypothetical protein